MLHIDGALASSSAIERVKLAESLGYESVYTTHIAGRESLTVLTAYALATSRIRVGTRRRADLHAHAGDDGADGRHDRRALRRALHARARRLAPAGRRGLARADDRPPGRRDARVRLDRARDPARRGPSARGEVADGLSSRSAWTRARQLPIYIAALSPAMLRLAGEIADGVILWLCNPRYIREVVIPEVSAGRERAGLPLDGLRRRGSGARRR